MRAGEIERARLTIATVQRLLAELRLGLEEADGLGPLTAARLDAMSRQERNVLLAFLKRFENAVEAGRRLFRLVVLLEGGDAAETGVIQALQRAERAGVLLSMQGWRSVTDARNAVAHEYAMSPDAAARAMAEARVSAASAVALLDHALQALARPPFAELLSEPTS